MEDLNIPLVIGAALVGGLIGLYFYGKSLKKTGNHSIASQMMGS